MRSPINEWMLVIALYSIASSGIIATKYVLHSLEFQSFTRSLEQFFLTVGQNNFGNKYQSKYFIGNKKPRIAVLITFSTFFLPIMDLDIFCTTTYSYFHSLTKF